MTGYWSRPRRDVGAYLAWLTAWLLVPIWYNFRLRDPEEKWSLAEVQGYARLRPDTGHALTGSNIVRTVAWFATMLGSYVIFFGVGWAYLAVAPDNGGLPSGLERSFFVVGAFAGAAGIVSSVRWALSYFLEGALDRRLGEARAAGLPARGLLVRLCAPSNVDMIFAAVVTWSLTLAHQEALLARV